MVRFGPAGNSESYKSLNKPSVEAPGWLKSMGLNAYEYQCGHGVSISEKSARLLGEHAVEHDISLSVHSPYYISLANPAPDKVTANINYVLKTCEAARFMGADRIVVHSGSVGSGSREEALGHASACVIELLKAMREQNHEATLCLETMGKIGQLGTLSEVLALCLLDETLLPCVDFGHIYARTHGEASTGEAYAAILDEITDKLGFDRAKRIHIHFSQIQFSSGGEVRHLNLDNGEYGPPFEALAELLAKRGFEARIICESAGLQAEDAVKMKIIYESKLRLA